MPKKKGVNRAKKLAKAATAAENITNEVIAAAYSAATPPIIPVFIKVCRLCESKDGPFLNIFDADKVTAKKIDDLMPFSITENDDLPHKICFRCSAKLEELYEFIQKCIKTQENLRSAVGNHSPFLTKSKMGKKLWEEKLTKSNMSNDDICDALIKKAMEGIKGIPLQPPIVNEPVPETKQPKESVPPIKRNEPVPETKQPQESVPPIKRITRTKEQVVAKKEGKTEPKSDDNDEVSLKTVKLSLEKDDTKPAANKTTRSSKQNIAETEKLEESPGIKLETVEPKRPGRRSKKYETIQPQKQETPVPSTPKEKVASEKKSKATLNNLSFDYYAPTAPISVKESDSEDEKKEPEKPFNIMDHISMIKVNGVGILFQCKLCNRNFLKKEVVESHSCAKNGVAKVGVPKSIPVPEPPKMPSVKYIKIDSDMKKSLTEKVKLAEKIENERNLKMENNTEQEKVVTPPVKPRPKVGPASKTKRNVIDIESSSSDTSTEPPCTTPPVLPPAANPPGIPSLPAVHFPNMPNLNGRFKLVPGPNNIFSLVEDFSLPTAVNNQPIVAPPVQETKKSGRKRKNAEIVKESEVNSEPEVVPKNSKIPEIIDLEDQAKPYPVGLFQTVGHSQAAPPTFTTPAMKKQSYTIVQTGNPSKLLISTKAKAVEVEAPKKRPRKAKQDEKEDSGSKQPFRVTLEDVAHPKDTGFFTFINVDPLLQPSYVLPTDNIIQESQISTSSAVTRQPAVSKDSKEKEKYTCNMCGEGFSREKKLLAHIQSHYSKLDEEDQERVEKTTKRRGKK